MFDVTPAAASPDEVIRRLYEAEYRPLVNMARSLVERPGDADEVVQEAFVRCLDRFRRKGVPRDPRPYVRTAVVNLARTGLRRKLLRSRRRLDRPDPSPAAEAVVVADDDKRRLTAAIRTLPARQRECVVYRYFLDAPVAETAEALGISEGSVKTHTHRALQALEEIMEEGR